MKLNSDLKTNLRPLLVMLVTAGVLAGCSDKAFDLATLESAAQAASKKEDRVTIEQMADWIISNKQDFRLLDIRSEKEFDRGHIEAAENIPLASLTLPDTLQALPHERKLVVYSNGSEQAAKASIILRVAGFDAYLLLGGYNHWQEHILNPDIPTEAADGEMPEQALKRAISCYFTDPGEWTVSQIPTLEVKPIKQNGFTPPLSTAAGGRPPVDEGC